MKNKPLQGLRAYAIALVVGEHTEFLMQGGLANDIFYCLSGFFAVNPFSTSDFQILSFKDALNFYKKKAMHILPPYILFLLLLKLLTGEAWYTWKAIFRALIFIECPAHLWFIQQIVFMYLLTPLIILVLQCINHVISINEYIVDVVVCLILSCLTKTYLTAKIFYLLGNGDHQALRIWQYLIGMAFGYIYKYIRQKEIKIIPSIAGGICWILLIFSVLSSNIFLARIDVIFSDYLIGYRMPVICTLLSGVFILMFALDQKSYIAKIFSSKYMVFLGNISFELYIVHWYLRGGRVVPHHFQKFLIVLGISSCVAYVWQKAIGELCDKGKIIIVKYAKMLNVRVNTRQ